MAELSYFWGGTTIGDSGPYNDDQFSQFIRILGTFTDLTVNNTGVLKPRRGGYSDSLEARAGDGESPLNIVIGPGSAIVHGKVYENTTDVSFTPEIDSTDDLYYTVVLRKTWATQTVRLALSEPKTSPDLTFVQNEGVVWEIPLYLITVPIEGPAPSGYQILDKRAYARFPGKSTSTKLTRHGLHTIPESGTIFGMHLVTYDTVEWDHEGLATSPERQIRIKEPGIFRVDVHANVSLQDDQQSAGIRGVVYRLGSLDAIPPLYELVLYMNHTLGPDQGFKTFVGSMIFEATRDERIVFLVDPSPAGIPIEMQRVRFAITRIS